VPEYPKNKINLLITSRAETYHIKHLYTRNTCFAFFGLIRQMTITDLLQQQQFYPSPSITAIILQVTEVRQLSPFSAAI